MSSLFNVYYVLSFLLRKCFNILSRIFVKKILVCVHRNLNCSLRTSCHNWQNISERFKICISFSSFKVIKGTFQNHFQILPPRKAVPLFGCVILFFKFHMAIMFYYDAKHVCLFPIFFFTALSPR